MGKGAAGIGGQSLGKKRPAPKEVGVRASRPRLGEQELTAWRERNGRMPLGPPEGEANGPVVESEFAVAGRMGVADESEWDLGELALWFGDG